MEPEHDESLGNVDEMVDTDYQERELPVVLTSEERLEIGEEICQAQAELENAQAEKKETQKTLDGVIEKHKNIVSLQSRILRSGKIEKKVQVQIIKNYREGIIKEVRMDTMESLVHRPMTQSERQRGLSL